MDVDDDDVIITSPAGVLGGGGDEMGVGTTQRGKPNILITGTPGTGKSTLAGQVAESTGLRHVDITVLAKERGLVSEWDDKRKCDVLDDEKVLDEIEDWLEEGGNVVDYHGCEFFPERWFDAVFVLRTDNTKLFDRLTARGYTETKVRENVECEIFGVLAEEAKESYPRLEIVELKSDDTDNMDANLDTIVEIVDGLGLGGTIQTA